MSKTPEQQPNPYLMPQGAYPLYMQQAANHSDEIDLFELVGTLWRKKVTIIAVMCLTTLLAGAYAFTAKEQWTSEAIIAAPTLSSISNVSAANQLLGQNDTINTVFKRFIDSSASYDAIAHFIAASDYFKTLSAGKNQTEKNQLLDKLVGQVSITPFDKTATDKMKIVMQAETAAQAQALLKSYLEQSNKQVVSDVYTDLSRQITDQLNNLSAGMAAEKSVAEAKRQIELADIQSAQLVAKQAGISKPEISAGMELKPNNLFLLGDNALSAMLNGIKKQPLALSDAYYAAQARYFSLQKFKLDSNNITLFSYLKTASMPVAKDKPQQALILVLGALLGGMLGVAGVLVQSAIGQRKNREVESI
ncbi:LPS O-antigen chain length determinant protein WzzB [Plesiomonas sp.]|uniref:LPS O-antigen chain length determinant protein WzzB n=1 Tax=Plesiomonas sp. TaxID=2486279 RepID=UPI003F3CFB6B